MKIRFLILCLILFSTVCLQVKANEDPVSSYSDFSSSSEHPLPPEKWGSGDYSYTEEDFSDEDFSDFDEEDFDTPDYERIMEIVDEINNVYESLVTELEGYQNRNLKRVVNKLDDCVNIFNEALGETPEEFPTSCEDAIKLGFKIFNRAISLLEERKCDPVHITRRCIPAEIADKYIPQLKELSKELEDEVLADNDEDGSPDICTYFEDWGNKGDQPQTSEESDSNNLQ